MVKDTIPTSRDSTIKKPRKKTISSTESGNAEFDLYKKLAEFEENEAVTRPPDADAQVYFETCQCIRQLLFEIATLKEQSTPESKDKIKEEIDDKRVDICMYVTALKKLNRFEKFRTKSGRDALHKEKLQADSIKHQLQNLLYELSYLKKEISKCFQFRSLHEEIDLISKEEFYKSAPESFTKQNNSDQHQVQLARLQYELQQRKQLSSECSLLEGEKEKVASLIISKQEKLQQLSPELNKILEVTKPLQEQLGMTLNKVQEEHQLAYLLPNPLFLLYAKVYAFVQVYGKSMSIYILGEEDEAKQLKTDADSCILPVDSDSDQELSEEKQERTNRHHRKSARVVESLESKQTKFLAAHPLHVQIKINLEKEKGATLILNFHYRLKLHVVTVKCEIITAAPISGISTGEILSAENILLDLFPNDNGKESPNPSTPYQLQQLKLGNFSTLLEQLGYPYMWAQRICGIDFISTKTIKSQPIGDSEISQANVETVMKALNQRFRSRISLAMQIQELERNSLPIVPKSYNVSLKLNSSISSWQRITWQEYCQCPSTRTLVEEQFVNNSDILYRAVLIRKEAKLVALISIKNNFPAQKSIFALTVHWNGVYHSSNSDSVRDMERAVNSDWPEENERKCILLLSAQMRRLVSCFDVYLEVKSPGDFPQEKIYFNLVRGRNRHLPLKYLNVGGGLYTQY